MSRVTEAAALMRERAEWANEGPWTTARQPNGLHEVRAPVGGATYGLGQHFVKVDAEHIASWHPDVALTIADALERIEAAADYSDWNSVTAALNSVADAYLT